MHPNNSQTADGSHIDTAEDYDSDDDLPPLVDITDDEDEDEDDTGAEISNDGLVEILGTLGIAGDDHPEYQSSDAPLGHPQAPSVDRVLHPIVTGEHIV